MTVKEIREALMTPGTIFKAPNNRGTMIEFKSHGGLKFDNDKNDFIPTGEVSSIVERVGYGGGMNVNKFGPTCVTLYTFDMMGNKTVAKIKYSEVKIVSVEEPVAV